MEVHSDIFSEHASNEDKEKIRRLFEDFIKLEIKPRVESHKGERKPSVHYSVYFAKNIENVVDCVLELRTSHQEAWLARALCPNLMTAFHRALACLRQLMLETDIRRFRHDEGDFHGFERGDAA